MAGPRARRSPRRNPPPTGKDEVAGVAPTEGSGTPTQAPAVARVPTLYSAIEMAGTRVRSSPRASIDSSGSHAFTLIPARAHRFLLRSSLQ